MKNKKIYLLFFSVIVFVAAVLLFLNNSSMDEKKYVKEFYPDSKEIKIIKNISDDMFITVNFPAVHRAYEVDGKIKAFVVNSVGYNGPVEVLVALDSVNNKLLGIRVLKHEEDEDYAKYIEESWFLERFKNLLANKYLNLVVLDKKNPEDIVQVTGATVSSQAVVNDVNSAIGAYQYLNNKIEMAKVADVVPQEMWDKDENSFAINVENDSIRINTDEIKQYEQVEKDVVLINTTGTKTDMHVKGPTLKQVLQNENIDLLNFEAIGITARDGYYTMVDKEKFSINDIILAWEIDGKGIKKEEKPIRVIIPNEMGPYWVKMVSNIDLYDEISPKEINKVHIFNALTADIEPYYYEYYGKKDKSIEVGKILNKFDLVDQKGFFTMAASDGLIKNETISLVRQRYFIKVEGDNAPMNIAPNFKLGMNVKNMTHFSTTKDAVIFPKKMKEVVRTKEIEGKEMLNLEDVLLTSGMRWDEQSKFSFISTDGLKIDLSLHEVLNLYLVEENEKVNIYEGNKIVLNNLLRIEKNEIK